MYRAIATDLDGTLLRSDGSISFRTAAALREMYRRGIPVIACTGRSLAEAMDALAGHPIHPILILLTGALVLDTRTGHVLSRSVIPSAQAASALNLLRRDSDHFFYVYNGANLHSFPEMRERISSCGLNARDIACTYKWMICDENLEYRVRSGGLDCEKIFAVLKDERCVPALRGALGNQAQCIRAGVNRFEILAAGNNKRTGLFSALREMRLLPNQILAFGDSENDIPLAQVCATFVAMGNADAELLRYTTEQTVTNDEDGVAVYIERMLREGKL